MACTHSLNKYKTTIYIYYVYLYFATKMHHAKGQRHNSAFIFPCNVFNPVFCLFLYALLLVVAGCSYALTRRAMDFMSRAYNMCGYMCESGSALQWIVHVVVVFQENEQLFLIEYILINQLGLRWIWCKKQCKLKAAVCLSQ